MFIAPIGSLFPALRRSAIYRHFAPTELRTWDLSRYDKHFASTKGEECHNQ